MRKKCAILFLAMSVAFAVGCGKTDNNKQTTEVITEATTAVTTETVKATPVDAEKPKDDKGYYISDDYYKVVDEVAYVQVAPSDAADTYRLYEEDEEVQCSGYTEDWVRVVVDGEDFYIRSKSLKKIDPPKVTEEEIPVATDSDANKKTGIKLKKKIVLDPCNQLNMNVDKEAVGPGSEETKQGASLGRVGVSLETREYDLNLTYALKLKSELESRGYEIVMTRENNDIDISNKERAELANESGASVYIRIQMNYSDNQDLQGIMAVTMKKDNIYNASLYSDSSKLATRLLQGLNEKVEATNHGILETDKMTAINWSTLPVATVKLGYLSNASEEAKLVDSEYQDEVIEGLANGIDYFFDNY